MSSQPIYLALTSAIYCGRRVFKQLFMDLTISLPNHVSEKAHSVANDMGISVDELFVLAIGRFLRKYREELVTETLDEVYATEPSTLDSALARTQSSSIGREEW